MNHAWLFSPCWVAPQRGGVPAVHPMGHTVHSAAAVSPCRPDGVLASAICGSHLIADTAPLHHGARAWPQTPTLIPASPNIDRSPAAPTGVVLSRAEYAALVVELDTLRAAHRHELAQRLHEVQTLGTAHGLRRSPRGAGGDGG